MDELKQPPLHIAILLTGLTGGGSQRRMLTLARAFVERGQSVDIVVPDASGSFRERVPSGARVVSLDATLGRIPQLAARKSLRMLAALPALARYVRARTPDVLLSSATPANLAALAAGDGVPVVACVNVPISQSTAPRTRPLLGRLVRRFYPRAAAIIAVADALAADTAASTGVARDKIVSIASPIAVDEIQALAAQAPDHPWFAPGEPPVILGVGKLKPQKDFATLLRAFAEIRRHRSARLLILGEGEQREALARLAAELALGCDVALPGFVANPFAYMARAALLVSSSRWEGFSNVIAEAMACGCPVVATNAAGGGGSDFLRDCGEVVPVGDHAALAAASLRLMERPPPKQRLVERAREHPVDRAASLYLNVLRTAVGRKAKARSTGASKRVTESPDIVEHRGAAFAGASRAHIAVFIHGLSGGGAQHRTVTLVNGFARRGHRVDLIVVSGTGPLRSAVAEDVNIVPLVSWRPGNPLGRLPRRVQLLLALPRLARHLRRSPPEVLLSAASHVHLPVLWAHRLAGVDLPVVLRVSNHMSRSHAHVTPRARVLAPRLARASFARADRIIAVSRGVADDIATVTGYPAERIQTIYSPIVTPELRERARAGLAHPWFAAGEPPVVLGVGRVVRQKDFPTLIRAFARVRAARPARLLMLGRANKSRRRRALEELIDALGVRADVCLAGYVDNPLPYMREAAVFVLSSAWEGLPGALIEALACGTPIVSTDCPSGPREILADGTYGRLVAVGDAEGMAAAIVDALDHPPDRERLRARAQEFSADANIDRYLGVLLSARRVACS